MTTCKLLIVTLLVFACMYIAGLTDAQAEVTVYDAEGQFLGISDGFPTIYMKSYDKLVTISTKDGDLNYYAAIYFESTDCSGQPYSRTDVSYRLFKNGEQYYMGENVAPVNLELKSRIWSDGRPCRSLIPFNEEMVPVTEIQRPINLPVALPMSFENEPAHPGKWK